MSLQALIEISSIQDLDREGEVRLEQARQRQRAYDREIEQKVAKKAVTQELLSRTCSI